MHSASLRAPHASREAALTRANPGADGPPRPERREVTFDFFQLHPELLKGIRSLGFTRPTPIQAQAIPAILSGRNVIGCAQTGTGKTAAFVLPILHRLLRGQRCRHMRALILAPTRELALQSMEHLRALSQHVHLKGAAIFGGVPMNPQIQALARGVDIVSATPGRLLDHIHAGRIDFVNLEVLVLDEFDRMLDMGFLPDIKRILSLLPRRRQNLAFSATMPPEVKQLVHEILRDPVIIEIGQRSSSPVKIRHAIYPVPRHLKTDLLIELLRKQGMNSTLVFTRTKHYANRLGQKLERAGISVSVLHGGRSQGQRLRALEHFRRGHSRAMVATDVAARGIDIQDISHVINFDMPATPDNYIHRTGRTARADATGDAFSLVAHEEEPLVKDVEKVMNRTLPRVTLPHFDYKKPAPRPHGHAPHRQAQRSRVPHRSGRRHAHR